MAEIYFLLSQHFVSILLHFYLVFEEDNLALLLLLIVQKVT